MTTIGEARVRRAYGPPGPCRHAHANWPRGVRWRGERGSGGSSLAFILLMPAVVLLIFGGIQFGLHHYARSLAVSAAEAGARSATAAPASINRGQQTAEDFITNQAAGTLTGADVTVTRDGNTITVTVTAAAPSVLPLTQPHVTGSATAQVEVLP